MYLKLLKSGDGTAMNRLVLKIAVASRSIENDEIVLSGTEFGAGGINEAICALKLDLDRIAKEAKIAEKAARAKLAKHSN
jgi:hypothetical protein